MNTKETILTVSINSVENANLFASLLSNFKSSCQLRNNRYENQNVIIDAKSLLGILSLDLTTDKELHIFDYADETSQIVGVIDSFIVKEK